MSTTLAILSGLNSYRTAGWHGRRAGREGLSIEEVADSLYMIWLRRETSCQLDTIAAELDQALISLAIDSGESEVVATRRDAVVRRARGLAGMRVAEYELLCAAYGRSWRRHHRDRSFVHLGWRCPRLTVGVEVGGHVFI